MNQSAEVAMPVPHGGILGRTAGNGRDLRSEFAAAAREHTGSLFALAARLTARREDAEDLVQETFLKAWRALPRFRGRSAVRTWLFRILVNAARDRWRKRGGLLSLVGEREAPDGEPGAKLDRREALDRVMAAVRALPRRQREALLLRARGGLSYAEIAEAMGIRVGAVKAHLVQARRKLSRRCGREVSRWTGEKR